MCEPITLAAAGTALESALFSIVPNAWIGASGIVMPAASLGTGLTAASGLMTAYGQYQQGKYQSQVAKFNQRVAQDQAADAERRGAIEEANHAQRVRQLMGAQRAASGASGVQINTGSPLAILTDTAALGSVDALTIRENTAREANAHRNQASLYGAEASNASRRGKSSAFSTVLTSGATLADRYYKK